MFQTEKTDVAMEQRKPKLNSSNHPVCVKMQARLTVNDWPTELMGWGKGVGEGGVKQIQA
jgi:hypothetical protein